MTVVYVDTLFLLNLTIDYLLLRLSARICGQYVPTLRLALGALMGAVYALCLGIACDLALPGSVPCFYTIALPLAAILAGLLTREWLSSHLLSALAASALSYLVTGLLHAGVLAVTGHGAFVTAMAVAGKEFLITLPALPLLYLLLRFLHGKTHPYGD